MPLSPTANYTTENTKLFRRPAYLVEFTGFTTRYATTTLPFSNLSPYMSRPSALKTEVKPEEGKAAVSAITFVLTDKSGDITQDLIAVEGFVGAAATFKAGYVNLVEADFLTFFTGVVDDYEDVGTSAYKITIRDLGARVQRSVYEVAVTSLDGAIGSGDATITVPSGGNQFFLASGHLRIDSEFIAYGSKVGRTFSGCTRGVLGTSAAAHSDGAQVQEMVNVTGHPMDIATSVYTNTDKTGLSIPAADVDTATFTAVKNAIGATLSFDFRITARTNAKRWLEDQIFRPCACYPVTTGDGKLSVKRMSQPVPSDVVDTFDTTNIVGAPRWLGNTKTLINWVCINHDLDDITGDFKACVETESTVSQDSYGKEPRTFSARGLRSGGVADAFISSAQGLILNRYKDAGAPVLLMRVHFQKNLVEAGEVVQVTHPDIPNRQTGTRGVTNALFEVVQRNINFEAGVVEFVLLATGFNQFASVWADGTIPAFTSATAQQKETYAWWADASGKNNTTVDGKRWGF